MQNKYSYSPDLKELLKEKNMILKTIEKRTFQEG